MGILCCSDKNKRLPLPNLAFLKLIGSRGAPSTLAPGRGQTSKVIRPTRDSLISQNFVYTNARRLKAEYRRDMEHVEGDKAPILVSTMASVPALKLPERDFSILQAIKAAKKYDRIEWKTNDITIPPNIVLTILDEPNCVGWIVQDPPAGVAPVFVGNDPISLSRANHTGIGLYPTATMPAEAREEDPARAASAVYAYHATAGATATLRVCYALRV